MGSLESSASQVFTIDVHAVKELIKSNYHYLDVRTEEEFNKGHVDAEKILVIPYMFNTPQGRVKNPNFLEQVRSAYKEDDQLVVGCQSGVRSLYATADMLQAGFKHVSNMGGGYLAWVENGYSVKKKEKEIPLKEQEIGNEFPLKKQEIGNGNEFPLTKQGNENEFPLEKQEEEGCKHCCSCSKTAN